MIVDFEGIDGSGKTTLSNRLAERLKAEGRRVVHLREGGRLGSRVSGDIRAFTRDQRQLGLCDRAELLLYAAREAQLHDELTRPALASGALVIADRSVYSHLAHAAAGRGLPSDEVEAVLRFAGRGAWPDVVVLVDCDPSLAKARKRCRKVAAPSAEGSRKGLAGEGFSVRVREALLELASRDPSRWIVLRNDGATLEELESQLTDALRRRLDRATRLPLPPPAALRLDPAPPLPAASTAPASIRFHALQKSFFQHLSVLAAREPGAAAYFLADVDLPEAEALRDRLVFAAPEMILDGLAGQDSDSAFRLRRSLVTRFPAAVLASLSGLPPEREPEIESFRHDLAEAAPDAVARSLKGKGGPAIDAWFERLAPQVPDAVLEALAGRDDAFAWSLRDRLAGDPARLPVLLAGLAHVDSARAWAVRDAAADLVPALLASLKGLASERAFDLREKWAAAAPKPVLRGLAGLDHSRAWALRERFLPACPEALEGLAANDAEPAWALRERGVWRWPARAVRSLGALARTPRGSALIAAALAAHPSDLAVQRAALLALLSPVSQPAPAVAPANEPARAEVAS